MYVCTIVCETTHTNAISKININNNPSIQQTRARALQIRLDEAKDRLAQAHLSLANAESAWLGASKSPSKTTSAIPTADNSNDLNLGSDHGDDKESTQVSQQRTRIRAALLDLLGRHPNASNNALSMVHSSKRQRESQVRRRAQALGVDRQAVRVVVSRLAVSELYSVYQPLRKQVSAIDVGNMRRAIVLYFSASI
jgi:hypothetical protein